jgi:hypothetical protein
MKKEKDKTQESDVGLTPELSIKDQLVQFKQLNDQIDLKRNFELSTNRIHSYLNNVMENYLMIGHELNKVESNKSYLANEYISVIEYAEKEFQLSTTTIRNSMAISNKFCNSYGQLTDKYKDFSYSQLVELLSVDQLELDNFKPAMTVKTIRSEKLINAIDKSLSTIYQKGIVKTYIDIIKTFDFNTVLKTKGFDVEYEAKKDKEFYDSWSSLNFVINFKLINNVTSQKLKFQFCYQRDEFRFDSSEPWFYETVTTLTIENVLKKYCDELIKKNLITPEGKKVVVKKAVNTFSQAKDVPSWYNGGVVDAIKDAVGEKPVYYNHKNNDTREIYLRPEVSKKNPAYLIIENSQDPFKMKLKVFVEVKDKEPIYKDDERVTALVEQFKQQFEQIVASYIKDDEKHDQSSGS